MPVCVAWRLRRKKKKARGVRWEGEIERPFPLPIIRRALSIFPLLLSTFIEIPRGSPWGGERFITFLVSDEPEKNANKGEGKGQLRDRGEREIEILKKMMVAL